MMMMPEAWAGNPLMDEERRAFYEYNAALMEPWDGPAALAFTDGRQIGATLDRNGLRPARYFVTRDGRVIMASEMGVLPIPEERDRHQVAPAARQDAARRSRRRPAHSGRGDQGEARAQPSLQAVAGAHADSCSKNCRRRQAVPSLSNLSLLDRQQAFGYTQEDLKLLMTPMATTGEEAVGSMGNDAPISALSDKPKPLFTYFKQNFAQVTNPPIDPIREELVMSLVSIIGPRPNLFDLEDMSNTKRLEVRQPILTNADLEKIRSISEISDSHFKSITLDMTWEADHGAGRMDAALTQAVRAGRTGRARRHQHHHPVRPHRRRRSHSDSLAARLRGRASSSDPQGIAHVGRACRRIRRAARSASFRLPGRLRRRSDQSLSRVRDADRDEGRSAAEARRQGNRQALHQVDRQGPAEGDVQDGHLDLPVLLRRADFRRGRAAIRFRRHLFHRHRDAHRRRRPRPRSPKKTVRRHRMAFGDAPIYRDALAVGGDYAVRMRGEDHVWTAETVSALQHAVRANLPGQVSRVRQDRERADRAAADHPRPVPVQERRGRRPQAGADRRGRAGEEHRASGSRPARCRTARSRARRIPRSRSR